MTDKYGPRELFEFPVVDENTPLRADPFWAWLDENVERSKPGSYLDHVKAYLAPMGYSIEKHTLGERALDILKYVHEMWCRSTPYFKPTPWLELFTDGSEFYLQQSMPLVPVTRGARTGISPKLKDMVEQSGFIYDVVPADCYFELSDDRLYAKYQQILGSRFICRVI